MRAIERWILGSAVLPLLVGGAAVAQGSKPLTKCATDAVVSGDVCIDRFEASVYRMDPVVFASLVKKIQQGKVTSKDLNVEGVDQLVTAAEYGDCTPEGAGCKEIFAISIAGQPPSGEITWFQAQQACKNSRKRLPTSAEWQAAVAGTPVGADTSAGTQCNINFAGEKVNTGQRTSCVSSDGAFDMVGNLREWVDDWVPLSTVCGDWPSNISEDDMQCLAGASVGANDEPGALVRGGGYLDGTAAGLFAIDGRNGPSTAAVDLGFRCVR